MRFIPILLSTQMVQAEQAGRKTKTRRLKGLQKVNNSDITWVYLRQFEEYAIFFNADDHSQEITVKCPYGMPLDVVWVRESWKPSRFAGEIVGGYDYLADHVSWLKKNGQQYTAGAGCETGERWKPSIHMPKVACRTFLQITNIRVQKLHDIDDSDVADEGVDNFESFANLWIKLNGVENWLDNPAVWVISFKRIDKPENFLL